MAEGSGARFVTVLLVVLLVFALVMNPPLLLVSAGPYERGTVTAVAENGSTLGTVSVRIADSGAKQRIGLSRTDSLGPDEGMWFAFEDEGIQHFHMIGMAFPLDIVFISADGTVTAIRHASVPRETAQPGIPTYSGRAKYVLEVPRGWTNETGVDVGDHVESSDSE